MDSIKIKKKKYFCVFKALYLLYLLRYERKLIYI